MNQPKIYKLAKTLKYIVIIGLLFLVGYKSVYIEKLDKHRERTSVKDFDANTYANDYFSKLVPAADSAISLCSLISQFGVHPEEMFNKYGHALGISSIKYFLINGIGTITAINESTITVALYDCNNRQVNIATEFVYGNPLRDASGLVDLKTFTNTSDLNNVSAAINRKVREQVIPPFIKSVNKGDEIYFAGAIELNQKFPDINNIEVIPVSLKKHN